MRTQYDEQLTQLDREMRRMGALCEQAIAVATKALMSCDAEAAAQVAPLEVAIDEKEREIETLCLRLFLQQQPVAGDLRKVSAALKMLTDLERIGDQAADIAEIIPFLAARGGEQCGLIADMARTTISMVTDSVDAFAGRYTTLAASVISRDDEVDRLFDGMKRALITAIAEKPDEGEYALDLFMVAKYLERIADHAVNIAEWAIFSVTGVHKGTAEP